VKFVIPNDNVSVIPWGLNQKVNLQFKDRAMESEINLVINVQSFDIPEEEIYLIS
jgi:hypothetical protein